MGLTKYAFVSQCFLSPFLKYHVTDTNWSQNHWKRKCKLTQRKHNHFLILGFLPSGLFALADKLRYISLFSSFLVNSYSSAKSHQFKTHLFGQVFPGIQKEFLALFLLFSWDFFLFFTDSFYVMGINYFQVSDHIIEAWSNHLNGWAVCEGTRPWSEGLVG